MGQRPFTVPDVGESEGRANVVACSGWVVSAVIASSVSRCRLTFSTITSRGLFLPLGADPSAALTLGFHNRGRRPLKKWALAQLYRGLNIFKPNRVLAAPPPRPPVAIHA